VSPLQEVGRRSPRLSTARGRAIATLLLGALIVSGCYSLSQPSFAPGDQRDVLRSITRRGIVVEDALAGEAACDDPELIGNVLYLSARLPHEAELRDVYVHAYRERSWEASKDEVDDCQADYAAAHPGSVVHRLDVPTFRVFGADWSDGLTAELRAALEEASRAGG
jgi:hypothetical protein